MMGDTKYLYLQIILNIYIVWVIPYIFTIWIIIHLPYIYVIWAFLHSNFVTFLYITRVTVLIWTIKERSWYIYYLYLRIEKDTFNLARKNVMRRELYLLIKKIDSVINLCGTCFFFYLTSSSDLLHSNVCQTLPSYHNIPTHLTTFNHHINYWRIIIHD